MPMLVTEQARSSTLEAAAQFPTRGLDPGFMQRFEADRQAMLSFSNSNQQHRLGLQYQAELQSQFRRESGGQRLPGWVDSMNAGAFDRARKQFDAWKADNPDSTMTFPTQEEFRGELAHRASEVRSRRETLEAQSTSWGSELGGFAGKTVGAIQDPINLLTSGLGGFASGIIRTFFVEAGIAAASEATIQAATYEFKRQVDPDYSIADSAEEVAAAAVGAGVLAGGVKGTAAFWHRVREGIWPRYVRDAGNVVTREASIPGNRFTKSVEGNIAHNSAVSKAIDDMANNRPVEIPQEAFVENRARVGRVYDSEGRSVGVKYEVVEAGDLVTSNNDDLSVNAAFPPELQPRDRTRALSQDQINSISNNLQPERHGPSIQAESGAPIVGAYGIVESGNARVLALRRAYRRDDVPAENYRAFLRSQGFDIEGMTNPVLIARRVTDLQASERIAFATAANRSTALRLGASEQALADARLIDPDLLSRLTEDDIGAAGNRFFVRGFMQKLPRAEQGDMIDKAGQLSQSGERRIASALMGRAYGEPALLGRALEDADNNIRSIGGALTDAAPAWSIMRDAVARGELPPGMDVTRDLMEAVGVVMKARDQGVPVKQLVDQAEMFGGPNEVAKIFARAMFSDADLRRPVSRKRLAAFLRDYADEAMKNDTQPRLLGEPLENADVLRSSLAKVGREDLEGLVEDHLTPENIEKMAPADETVEAVIQEANRLRAENPDLKVDVDGVERSLDDIFDEADDEIAAANDLAACALGLA